jgi:hypothetical protein
MNNKCLLGVDKGGTNHPLFSGYCKSKDSAFQFKSNKGSGWLLVTICNGFGLYANHYH